jgi:hypothetical protein
MEKKMWLRLIIVASLVLAAAPLMASDFCRGFEHGYVTGHKQASGSSLEPLTPLCPLEPPKRLNDPDSDFEHGYLIGYADGYARGAQ